MGQNSQPLMQHAAHELAIKPSISTLAQGSMFWQPDYRKASLWLEHLPFLFWLVEALKPANSVGVGVDLVSHYAVCQAISRLRLGGHSYIIGEADAEQGHHLTEKAADQYAGISQWLQVNPTRAIQQFNERSIDLLLLNVTAEDDSIDYLVDRWLSRLSDKGVILLPGIARREPGCQAFRAFEELNARYPHFAFYHGAGLGVLVVGDDVPPLINNLLGSLESAGSTQVVQDVFGRLGRSCQDKVAAQEQQALAQLLEARLSEQSEALAASKAQVETVSNQYEYQKKTTEKLRAHLEQQEKQFAQERDNLTERVNALEEFNQELKQEVIHHRQQVEQREAEYHEQSQQENVVLHAKIEQLHQAVNARDESNATLRQQLDESEQQRLTAHAETTQWKQQYQTLESEQKQHLEELATLTKLLEEKDQASVESQREVARLKIQLQEQKASVEARFKELGLLTRKQQETESALAAVKKERVEAEKGQAAAEAQVEQYKSELSELTVRLNASDEREKEALAAVEERFNELAVLTKLLEQNEDQREQLKQELRDAEVAKQKLEHAVKASQTAQAKQRREIERQTRELASLVDQLESLRDATAVNTSFSLAGPVPAPPVMKASPLTKRALKRQVTLIEASRWFDAKWYLAQYPDIAGDAKMAAQPARHYLLMGGFEGRNPGPEFDSAYYLAQNPDVVESGINPLVHYLKFGEKEQRSTKGH